MFAVHTGTLGISHGHAVSCADFLFLSVQMCLKKAWLGFLAMWEYAGMDWRIADIMSAAERLPWEGCCSYLGSRCTPVGQPHFASTLLFETQRSEHEVTCNNSWYFLYL